MAHPANSAAAAVSNTNIAHWRERRLQTRERYHEVVGMSLADDLTREVDSAIPVAARGTLMSGFDGRRRSVNNSPGMHEVVMLRLLSTLSVGLRLAAALRVMGESVGTRDRLSGRDRVNGEPTVGRWSHRKRPPWDNP